MQMKARRNFRNAARQKQVNVRNSALSPVLVVAGLICVGLPSSVYGQTITDVVFVALSTSDGKGTQPGVSFPREAISGGDPLDCSKLATPAEYSLRNIVDLLGCALADTQLLGSTAESDAAHVSALSLAARARAVGTLQDVVARERGLGGSRVSGGRDDGVLLVGFHDATLTGVVPSDRGGFKELYVEGHPLSFTIDETERRTQLAAGLSTLAEIALAVRGDDEAARLKARDDEPSTGQPPTGQYREERVVWLSTQRYQLRNERSTISLSYKFRPSARRLVSGLGPLGPYSARQLEEWNIEQQLYELTTRLMTDADGKRARPCGQLPAARRELLSDWETAIEQGERRSVLRIAAEPANTLVALCVALRETDATARIAAVEALGRSGTALARRVLTQLVDTTAGDVRAAAVAAGSGSAQGGGQAAQADGVEAETASVSLVSGRAEHWYLSADVMMTDEVRWAREEDGGLGIGDAPPVFYVGANYLLGDLLANRRPRWGNIFLKVFVKGSKRPQDSVGVGVGWRGLTIPLVDLELLSPFVARTWTRGDGETGNTERHWRFGVSLNLDRALKWLEQ